MDFTPAEHELWRITNPYDQFLQNRLTTIRQLFRDDAFSMDATILAGTVLTALGDRRYGRRNADQENLERLLLDYWPAYVDRVSIPRLLDALRREQPVRASLIADVERAFPVHTAYSQIRQVSEDLAV